MIEPGGFKFRLLNSLEGGGVFFDTMVESGFDDGLMVRLIFFKPVGGQHRKVAELRLSVVPTEGFYYVQEVPFDPDYRPLNKDRFYRVDLAESRRQKLDEFALLSSDGEIITLKLGRGGVSRLTIVRDGETKSHYSTTYEDPNSADRMIRVLIRKVKRVRIDQKRILAAIQGQ